jgi:uncharacterized protein with von Willebrand factor type A (vWA) domain
MVDELVRVAQVMRAGGARVGTGEVEAAALALGAVPASRADAYLALRAVLCSRRADLPLFDTAFAAVFGAPASGVTPPTSPDLGGAGAALPRVAGGDEGSGLAPEGDPAMRPAAYSDVELLLDKDFAQYTDRERALARVAIARLARRGPTRRSRRMTPAARRGARPDLQRTVRASLRTGGDPLHRRWREPATRPRRLVLVCDVSGSMAPYARVLLQYLHAAVAAHRRVEAFAFGTRLTRLTRELDERDPDRALERAAEAVVDWSGGTRIGASLSTLNREYGRRIGRGAVVVILSDGWDRGDPDELAREMGRLRRSAHRVIWLNPLKAAPGYEPLARGMAAALPETDHFLAGNSLASLAALAEILEDTT